MLCYIRGGAKREVKPRGWGAYNLLQTKYFRECNTPADYGKKKDHGRMSAVYIHTTIKVKYYENR